MSKPEYHIFICTQRRPDGHPRGSCGAKDGGKLFDSVAQALIQHNLQNRIALTATGCLGPCQAGANVLIYPGAVMYSWVEPEDAARLVERHFLHQALYAEKLAPAELW